MSNQTWWLMEITSVIFSSSKNKGSVYLVLDSDASTFCSAQQNEASSKIKESKNITAVFKQPLGWKCHFWCFWFGANGAAHNSKGEFLSYFSGGTVLKNDTFWGFFFWSKNGLIILKRPLGRAFTIDQNMKNGRDSDTVAKKSDNIII